MANSMAESAHRENMLSALAGASRRMDDLICLAEKNGWNAALNEARERLPPEYSLLLKPLYK